MTCDRCGDEIEDDDGQIVDRVPSSLTEPEHGTVCCGRCVPDRATKAEQRWEQETGR